MKTPTEMSALEIQALVDDAERRAARERALLDTNAAQLAKLCAADLTKIALTEERVSARKLAAAAERVCALLPANELLEGDAAVVIRELRALVAAVQSRRLKEG